MTVIAVQFESSVAMVEMELGIDFPAAVVSAAWRKLLLKAEMAAPHTFRWRRLMARTNAVALPAEPLAVGGFASDGAGA